MRIVLTGIGASRGMVLGRARLVQPSQFVIDDTRLWSPVAVAVAPRVRSHVLARVLLSIAEIARGPITLVRRASDGTLRGAPVTLLTTDRELHRRDLLVSLQSGTYALSRRERRITLRLPEVRQRPTEGINFAHLDSLIARLPHRRVVVRAEPDTPARDLMDVAWRVVAAGEPLALRAR